MPTPQPSDAPAPPDARRTGGERTRRLLIETAQELLAERGESAIRLRDLTEAAGTNVAAVHYHFGALGTLLAVAATEAVERIIDAQVTELESLPADATLLEISAAYFRPMVEALSGPSSPGRAYVRVLSRVASDPPEGLQDWSDAATGRAHAALIGRLVAVLPHVPQEELAFRAKCVGGILVTLSAAGLEPDFHGRSAEEMERMLAPVVAGALAGG